MLLSLPRALLNVAGIFICEKNIDQTSIIHIAYTEDLYECVGDDNDISLPREKKIMV